MLQTIRDHTTGFFAWAVVILLSVPFALWGIHQYASVVGETYVAKVNGKEISPQQFRTAYQNQYQRLQQMMGAKFNADMIDEKQLKDRVLQQLINQTLLDQQVEQAGYRMSDSELAQQVQQLPAFQAGGQFSSQLYEARLRAQGMTPNTFEARYRQALRVQQFQSAVATSALATDKELAGQVALKKQQRRLAYLIVPVKDYLSKVKVPAAKIAHYYKAHRQQFMTPEKVSLAYVSLSADQLAKRVKVKPAALHDLYAQQKQNFKQAEQRRVRHILIKPAGDSQAAAAKAKAQAKQILSKIKSGAKFAALAKKYSDDTGSAAQGGELGWVTRGDLVKPFQKALFAMRKGQVRGPVHSQYGYHIIQLQGIRKPKTKPFAAVRDQLAAQYKKKHSEDEYYKLGDKLANLAYSHSGSLKPVSKALGVPVNKVEGVTRGSGQGIGSNPKVRKAAFSDSVLKQGLNSDPIELGENHAVVVRLVSHQPAKQKPLKAVRNEIKQRLKRKEAAAKAGDVAATIAKAAAGVKSLKQAAKQRNLKFVGPKFMSRDSQKAPAGLLSAAFKAPKSSRGKSVIRTASIQGGDYVVFAMDKVKPGNYHTLTASNRKSELRQLQQQNGTAEFAAYIDNLRRHADVNVKRGNM